MHTVNLSQNQDFKNMHENAFMVFRNECDHNSPLELDIG